MSFLEAGHCINTYLILHTGKRGKHQAFQPPKGTASGVWCPQCCVASECQTSSSSTAARKPEFHGCTNTQMHVDLQTIRPNALMMCVWLSWHSGVTFAKDPDPARVCPTIPVSLAFAG